MHVPVLLQEAVEIMDPKPGETFVDGTVGAGGHAALIIKAMNYSGTFVSIDWDESALIRAKKNIEAQLPQNHKLRFVWVNDSYANIRKILEAGGIGSVDGLLVDLGFSSDQLEDAGRGFSFLKDEPLDMRFDPKRNKLTAADVVNGSSEKELAQILYEYGEERYSRRIAANIVAMRRKKKFTTTSELVEAVNSAIPKSYQNGRIHPATRTFQALRIYVNDELENLKEILSSAPGILNSGGRMVVISFHSLEDRIVKEKFREMDKSGEFSVLSKKPVTASQEEIFKNSRARSAKLRAIQKV